MPAFAAVAVHLPSSVLARLPQQEVPPAAPGEPPVPGGVAAVVRFLFHVPQPIQIGGLFIAFAVAFWLGRLLWARRHGVVRWLRTRPAGVRAGLAAAAVLLVLGLAAFGKVSWDYTQHDNDFCTGCHVMIPAFGRFTQSKHAQLLCHDCHRQSIFASARQLVLWVVERPEEIGPHAKVPTPICAECHIREEADSTWERISATAGHRVHLASTDSALRDVQCVTCHGAEVHRFAPTAETCGQAGCHEGLEIVLGRMAGQTALHCVGCHEFTAPVAETAPVDTAARGLVPGASQCLACHAMQALLEEFDPEREPHGGRCGDCHDPHKQTTPSEAFETCTGCHAEPDTLTPFHRGLRPRVLETCGECHEAHRWVVDGRNCVACHTEFAPGGSPHAPEARSGAGTTPGGRRVAGEPSAAGARSRAHRALRPTHRAAAAGRPALRLAANALRLLAEFARDPARPVPHIQQPPYGPFRHEDHRTVSCTDCHTSERTHGSHEIRTARDCAACHHAPARAEPCAQCHETSEIAGTHLALVTLRTARNASRTRELPFTHDDHRTLACDACHRATPEQDVVRGCADCHDDHHRPRTRCRACHAPPAEEAHPREVHLAACTGSGCHARRLSLQPTRSVCLGCHQDRMDHEPGRGCAACHAVPADAWK